MCTCVCLLCVVCVIFFVSILHVCVRMHVRACGCDSTYVCLYVCVFSNYQPHLHIFHTPLNLHNKCDVQKSSTQFAHNRTLNLQAAMFLNFCLCERASSWPFDWLKLLYLSMLTNSKVVIQILWSCNTYNYDTNHYHR